MKCEMCGKENAESRGIKCSKYKVCNPCVEESIHARMWLIGKSKENDKDYLYGVKYEVSTDDGTNK